MAIYSIGDKVRFSRTPGSPLMKTAASHNGEVGVIIDIFEGKNVTEYRIWFYDGYTFVVFEKELTVVK
jgi:hypothetical protein